MIFYTLILFSSLLFFGAVHTYAYTFMNISILILSCRYLIQWKNDCLTLVIPKTSINILIIFFGIYMGLYIIPLPQSLIYTISKESAQMNQIAMPPMILIENNFKVGWGTLAITDYPVRNACMQYCVYVLFFWGLICVLNTPKRLKQFSVILVIIGATQSLYGIIQTFTDPSLILWVPKEIFKNQRDASGTLINRNHFAALMTILMIFSVSFSASLTDRESRQKRNASFKKKLSRFFSHEHQWNQKILFAAAAALMGLGIIFSASRGGLIAAFPGAFVLMIMFSIRKITRKQGIIMIAVCLIIAGFAIFIGENRLINRLDFIQRSMLDRMRYLEKSIELIKDYPIFGVGPSNFEHAFSKYQSSVDQHVTITHVHNDWVQLTAEMGFVGLLAVIIILVFYFKWIFSRWRMRNSPVALCIGIAPLAIFASAAVHSLFDFPFHIPGNMITLIAIFAVGYQALHLIDRKNKSKTLARYHKIPLNRKNIFTWILFAGVFALILITSTRHFIAESYCNTVPNSTLKRDQNPELYAIQNAIFWDSENPVYWYRLAWKNIQLRNTLSPQKDLVSWLDRQHKIIYALEQAVQRNPCEGEYHIRLAWIYHQLQKYEHSTQKPIAAGDIAMKNAAYVCNNKSAYQHLEMGHYWNMRASQLEKKDLKDDAWKKAVHHYKKALKLDRKSRCKPEIMRQMQMYKCDEVQFKNVFSP
ncbi:O-antigen ligase-related protein [Candidatus Magnetomorum sp. HK-1]|nr:O-antigen ligase-related protein [Candidatus Magnetomorum sp. HK-1]